ncbi:prolipoprotein diacylglyceryl transferase family protein [Ruminococcus sp.]|uniref:prolipoprotein diacylglyceryl transferase family protein n=1 Tax=Ruminococcus sp. TaxID=41978 RepID=UPI0025D7AB8A|nr:prolipoprotein diacylglyceryl transferase family protein [Ruminococcus sp.]
MSIHICTDYSLFPPYALMIAISFVAGLVLQYFLNIKRGIQPMIAGFITLLSPLMSFFFAFLLTYATSDGSKFGLSSMGGLFGMYLSVVTLALIKRDPRTTCITLENCTLVMPLMYSISKLGCFFAGCCHGIPYHGPCCVKYSGKVTETDYIFPVQLTETIVFFLIFAIGMIMLIKNYRNTSIYILSASAAAKGFLDFLRESHMDKIISFNQILCIIVVIIGIVYITAFKRKSNCRTTVTI